MKAKLRISQEVTEALNVGGAFVPRLDQVITRTARQSLKARPLLHPRYGALPKREDILRTTIPQLRDRCRTYDFVASATSCKIGSY